VAAGFGERGADLIELFRSEVALLEVPEVDFDEEQGDVAIAQVVEAAHAVAHAGGVETALGIGE
jgi:hypothetical protein